MKRKNQIQIRIALFILMLFSTFISPLTALAESNGDIKNNPVSVGNDTTAGGVKLTKTVSGPDNDGNYTISLTATGKKTITNESSTAKLYVAVALDTSSSMKGSKINNAVAGTKSFASQLITRFPSAQLALVTYDDDAKINRSFANQDFDDITVTIPDKFFGTATHLGDGVKKARQILQSAKAVETDPANYYMIVIGDGEPTGFGDADYEDEATAAKQSGIEIYTIGYDVADNSSAQRVLQKIATDNSHYSLANVAEISAKLNAVISTITVESLAGTSATINDTIGSSFEYVPGTTKINNSSTSDSISGQTVSVNIGNITEDGTTVSFKVKPNNNISSDGWCRTNDSASITYTNVSGSEDQKYITESPEVYLVAPRYSYTVRYVEKQEDESLIDLETPVIQNKENAVLGATFTEQAKTITGYAPDAISKQIVINADNNEVIFYYTKQSFNSQILFKYGNDIDSDRTITAPKLFGDTLTVDQDTINNNLVDGYKFSKTDPENNEVVIGTDESGNKITVCYEIRNDLSYTVNYLEKGSNKVLADAKTINNQTFGNSISEQAIDIDGYTVDAESKSVTITTGTNVINFLYTKRSDLTYTVKYVDSQDNSLRNPVTRNNKTFGETYTEDFLPIDGYTVDAESKSVTITTGTNEIKFVYSLRNDLSYTVNYLEKGSNKVLADAKTINNQTFGNSISEQAIDIDGYTVDSNSKSVTITTGTNVINFLYTKRSDLTYTVKYVDSQDNSLRNPVTRNNKTFGETYTEDFLPIDGYTVDAESKSVTITTGTNEIKFVYSLRNDLSYTVNYLEKGSNKVLADAKTINNQTFGNSISEQAIDIDGYTVDSNSKSVTITTGTNVINFLYTKRSDLTYTVKYVDSQDNSLRNPVTRNNKTFGETYTEDFLPIDGYTVDAESKSVTITTGTNEIKFVYSLRNDLSYTVNYLEKGSNKVLADAKTINNQTFGNSISEQAIDIDGYTVDSNSKSVTITTGTNVINFFYTKRNDLSYTVEYYLDEIIDSSKTVTYNDITFEDTINTYEDKLPEGYMLDKVENLPLTISTNIEDNVIRVYYISAGTGGSDIDEEIVMTGENGINLYNHMMVMAAFGLLVITTKKKQYN